MSICECSSRRETTARTLQPATDCSIRSATKPSGAYSIRSSQRAYGRALPKRRRRERLRDLRSCTFTARWHKWTKLVAVSGAVLSAARSLCGESTYSPAVDSGQPDGCACGASCERDTVTTVHSTTDMDGASMTDLVSCLRNEIVASENARLDFIKWKIVLIAALGAVGLGLASDTKVAAPAVLGFIPIACAYVDVVCAHVNFRILLIAHFLRTGGKANRPPDSATADYEALCEEQRGGFRLGSVVLVGTTIAMSLLVALVALESRSLSGQLHLGAGLRKTCPRGSRTFCGSALSSGVSSALGRHGTSTFAS